MNFLIPIFTRRAKVEAVSILPISGGRGLSGRVHPYPLRGRELSRRVRPYPLRGRELSGRVHPYPLRGRELSRRVRPYPLRGRELSGRVHPYPLRGRGLSGRVHPYPLEGTGTFQAGTLLSPGGDGDWQERYSSGSSTSWVRSSFTLSFPTLSTNSLRRGCRVAWR